MTASPMMKLLNKVQDAKKLDEEKPMTEQEPAAEEGETIQIETMPGKQLDALVADNEIEVPADWKKLTVANKKQTLLDMFGDGETAEAPDAPKEAPEATDLDDDAKNTEAAEASNDIEELVEHVEKELEEKEAPVSAKTNDVTTDAAEQEKNEPQEEPIPNEGVSDLPPKETPDDDAIEEALQSKAVAKSKVLDGEVIDKNDQLVKNIQEIENMNEKETKESLAKIINDTDFQLFRVGGMLSNVQVKGWFEPYSSFKEYVEGETSFKYRKAMYWIGIYNTLVENEIPYTKVASIGWTKLMKIAPILNADNFEKWVALAGEHSALALGELVKTAMNASKGLTSDGSEKAEEVKITKPFHLFQSQLTTVMNAIEKAQSEGGTDNQNAALEYVALSYLGEPTETMEQRLAKMGIEKALETVHKAFPEVKLAIT